MSAPVITADVTTADAESPTTIVIPRHTAIENVLGMATGTVIVSLGLALLKASHAVTGGTAGLALLLSYAVPISFGLLYFVVTVPFLALAVWKKGWSFALRTLACVAAVSAITPALPHLLSLGTPSPIVAVVLGNLLAGVGMLILFRHGSSLGGVNTLALIAQERFGWRAGYVQMAFDVAIIASAVTVVPLGNVALSALGGVVLNLVLALNHRPGRYLAA